MSQAGQDQISGISGRYSVALFELIQEEYDISKLDKINNELTIVGNTISQSEEMLKIIQSPIYNAEEQFTAMKAVLEVLDVSSTTINFVGVLCNNRRLFVLPDVIKNFRGLLNNLKGKLTATVIACTDLTDDQINNLKKVLAEKFSQDVDINLEVDDKILGGLIVKIGSKMVDASLLTRLKLMQSNMNEV